MAIPLQLAFLIAMPLEMRNHLVDMHHVHVFVMHVEQVDLVRQDAAVEAALLHQHHMVAVGIGIDRGRAHAARRALAADDQRLHAELGEMGDQRRAEEYARALLGDDDVLRLRLELRPDGVVGRIDRRPVALGRGHQAGRLSARTSPVE